MASLVCVACGATTVDPRGARGPALGDPTAPPVRPGAPAASEGLPDDLTLEEPVLSLEGLAALGEAGFESELEHLRTQRRRQFGLVALALMAGLAFVVLVPMTVLGVAAVRQVWEWSNPEVPSMPVPADGEEGGDDEGAEGDEGPDSDDEGSAEGEEGSPEGTDEPEEGEPDEVPDEPEPDGDPVEAPVEPVPADPVTTWIKKGWKVASREPSVGAESFRKALELSPRHPEASYGLGYCLMKQGDLAGAQQHLCVARTSSKADIRRDVDALLANNGLACSP